MSKACCLIFCTSSSSDLPVMVIVGVLSLLSGVLSSRSTRPPAIAPREIPAVAFNPLKRGNDGDAVGDGCGEGDRVGEGDGGGDGEDEGEDDGVGEGRGVGEGAGDGESELRGVGVCDSEIDAIAQAYPSGVTNRLHNTTIIPASTAGPGHCRELTPPPLRKLDSVLLEKEPHSLAGLEILLRFSLAGFVMACSFFAAWNPNSEDKNAFAILRITTR